MRLTSHAVTRSWVMLAAALLTAVPVGASPASAAPVSAPRLPHAVGGYLPSPVRVVARPKPKANEVLPTSVDLRAYAPAPGNQGQVGSCVAWAIAHGIMGYYANRTGGVGAPYAPLFLYMRNVAPGGAPTSGLNADAVLANARTGGVDTQDDYWQGTTAYQTAPTPAQIANATNYRVTNWARLFSGANQGVAGQTVVMQALASGSPVALGFPVYRDFNYLGSHALYNPVSGTSLGGHMVAAFGYDAQGVWIRNSWGTSWGNGGDAKLSWAFINKAANGAYSVSGITTPATPIAMPPTVAALSVVKAAAGASVTITGAGLTSATAVRFGSDPADFTTLTTGGLTKLVATAPAHALGVVDITVTNASGTSATGTASKFTYIPPPPAVTGLSPTSVSVVGGATVTLTGTNLTGVTSLKVGTGAVSARAVTATSLTFTAPARVAGPLAVTVTTPYGTSPVVAAGQLTFVTPPASVVQSIVPSSGLTYRATPVVVTGTGFAGTTKVTSNGTAVPFVRVSETSLKVTLPIHAAGAVSVQVTTPGGVSSVGAGSSFTYLAPPAPAITGIVPTSGLTYVRTPVVVNGVNFTDATKITVGGVQVPFTKVSGTQLKLILPVHAAGVVDIQVTTPGGASPTGADTRFGYVAPPVPVLGTVTPSSGKSYLTNVVLLAGADLAGTSKVTANGTSVPFVKVSATQIRVTLTARAAGAVSLVVTTAGGTTSAVVYTAIGAPVPVITALSVATGRTNAATPVVITGSGFTDATKVTVGGAAAAYTRVSDTQLRMTAPPRPVGAVPIVIVTPGGPSVAATFTYVLPPAPAVSALSPAAGPAGKAVVVSIGGSGFTGATRLTLGGVAVSFTVVSPTQLRVVLPARAAGSYDLVVTGPGGSNPTGTTSRFQYA